MALQTKFGTITTPAAAGTQVITGVGFTPKAVMFFGVKGGSQGQPCAFRLGFDDGTTRVGHANNSGGAAHGSEHMWSTSYSLVAVRSQGSNQQIYRGYISTLGVDGYTITWDTILVGSGITIYYCAIGGTGISCKVGYWTSGAAGSTAVTGVGFLPTGVLGSRVVGSVGTFNGTGGANDICFGATGAACGSVGAATSIAATLTTGVKGIQANAQWLQVINSGTVGNVTTTTSLDADGFTVSNTASGAGAFNPYLAINGVAVNVGVFTQPTSTGPQNVAITAGDPLMVLFAGNNKAQSASVTTNALWSFGVATLTDQRGVWTGDLWGDSGDKSDSKESDDYPIVAYTPTGNAASTLNSRASLTSWTNGQFTLNWDTVDGVAREWFYLVFGTSSASACGAMAAGSINVIKNTAPIPGGSTVFTFTTTGGLSPSTFTLTDGDSQQFTGLAPATYGVTEVPIAGWTTTYSVSKPGSTYDALVIAADSITVTVTNTFQSSTPTFRRYRRFALPYDENQRIVLARLEVIAQMGVGNSAEAAPVMQIRLSKDGGSTFGEFRTLSLGAAAAYTTRAYSNRWGQGRNLVVELICDDPVFVAFIACFARAEAGTS